MTGKLKIFKGWALFLDRDGVINQRIQDNYVKHPDDFIFIPGVKEALVSLSEKFDPVIIVTNQQGIGRSLMTAEQLSAVHQKMTDEITAEGGRIDAIFFSPDLKNTRSFTRKPAVGMGLRARKQFPSISFKRSVIVGDTFSDILFGHRLGMVTVLIGNDKDVVSKCSGILDFSFPDLISFARFVEESAYQ